MSSDDKTILIRNYSRWSHLTDDEYEELNIVHNFVEAAKDDYVILRPSIITSFIL